MNILAALNIEASQGGPGQMIASNAHGKFLSVSSLAAKKEREGTYCENDAISNSMLYRWAQNSDRTETMNAINHLTVRRQWSISFRGYCYLSFSPNESKGIEIWAIL